MTAVHHIRRIAKLVSLAKGLARDERKDELVKMLADIRTDTQWLRKQIMENKCNLCE